MRTCQRACRSKTTWTLHLRSVHSDLDFSKFRSENAIIDLPDTSESSPPNLDNRRALGSLPTSPAVTPNAHVHADSEYDYDMEDITHWDVAGSDFLHFRSSPSLAHGSEVGDNKESHPIINGKFLPHFDHTTIESLQVNRVTRMEIRFPTLNQQTNRHPSPSRTYAPKMTGRLSKTVPHLNLPNSSTKTIRHQQPKSTNFCTLCPM